MSNTEQKEHRIAIIGLGYVGLPLALHFIESDCHVIAIDSATDKVEALAQGRSYIHHIAEADIQAALASKRFTPTTEVDAIASAQAIVLCLPTPLGRHREPDLSYVLNTAETIAPHLQKGQLIVLESTIYPGATEGALRETLETLSGMRAGQDFALAYSPERENPGSSEIAFKSIPKIVGGLTSSCCERAVTLYSQVVDTVVPVSSCRTAEAAKLLENIFRSVNIALVNELKTVYSALDIDIWEVIEAAKTKPFGFMPFYPGPGLGGHCLPIDPFYLTWKAREIGENTRFIELAGEVNTAMPDYVIRQVTDALNDDSKPLKGSRILLLGLAYKANVDDDRESPSYALMAKLEAKGAITAYHDPYVPSIRPTRSYPDFAGRSSTPISADFDLLLLVTPHREYQDFDFSDYPIPLVDTRNCVQKRPQKYYKA